MTIDGRVTVVAAAEAKRLIIQTMEKDISSPRLTWKEILLKPVSQPPRSKLRGLSLPNPPGAGETYGTLTSALPAGASSEVYRRCPDVEHFTQATITA